MDNLENQTTVNVQGNVQQQQTTIPAQGATVIQSQPVSSVQPNNASQALFTQEQLNSIISNRVNPLNQKITDLSNQLAQAQQLSQSYLNELTGYKHREIATKVGVPDKFVDFAVFEASKLAVDGKGFEDAMKEYVTSNQQLFVVANNNNQVSQSTQTPVDQSTTQGVVNPAQIVNAQNVQQAQTQNIAPQIQYGTTGIQNTQSTPLNANIEAEVAEFLKNNHLIK